MWKLEIEDLNVCFICGAKEKSTNNSLHCWDIEYECGCEIWGAVYEKQIYLNKPCDKILDEKDN